MQSRHHRRHAIMYLAGGAALLAGALAALFFWQGQGLIVGLEEKQTDHRVEVGVWNSTFVIEQSFLASHANLCRIDVFFDSYYPWHSPYLDFRLFEITWPEASPPLAYADLVRHVTLVRAVRLNGWLISSHMFQSIAFEPIPDSQGKRYLISLRSPALKEHGMFILMASPEDQYDDGDFFVNGRTQRSDLAFRALYRQPRRDVIRQGVARLTLQKPWPFAWPPIYYMLVILYIGGVLGLGWLLTRQNTKKS